MAALEEILQQHPVWRGGAPQLAAPAVPTGYAALDRAARRRLAERGADRDLGSQEGIGELQLVLPALAALTSAGKRVVWLAPPHLPYAPALAAAGVELANLAVVRAPGRRDALWAAEQALRAGSCHALARLVPPGRATRICAGSRWRPRRAAPWSRCSARAQRRRILACLPAPRARARGEALAVRILKRRGAPAAAPLRLPVKRPVHALGRAPFPCLPPHALAPIAAWACQFTPRVSLEPPQELLLEVEGSLRLFGGLGDCGRSCARGWRSWAYPFAWRRRRPRARRCGARAAKAKPLEALPVGVTRLRSAEFFRSIGIATLGEIAAAAARRPGAALRRARAATSSTARSARCPSRARSSSPPARFAAQLELPAEVAHAEGLLFAARRLLVQLEGLLAARQAGIRAFRLQFWHVEPPTLSTSAWLRPAASGAYCATAARAAGRAGSGKPVEAIRARGGRFRAAAGRQRRHVRRCAPPRPKAGRGSSSGCARASATTRCTASPRSPITAPSTPGGASSRANGIRASSARRGRARVAAGTGKLMEGEFTPLAGPERIESGWWDGDEAKRDYFVARLPNASLAWVYREAGEWYLHGLFA